MKRHLILIPILLVAGLLVACGGDSDAEDDGQGGGGGDKGSVTLRLGYFGNITHSQPLVGLNNGIFAEEVGADVTIEEQTFNAGPDVITALFAGEIDASFIGPNPAINGFVQSNGEALRIVSGATSGGALFVVHPDAGIASAGDLEGKTIATPQLGNTQDVALRKYLEDNGLAAEEQGGNVKVLPQANADALAAFQQGTVDGAWVPEPWATRIIQEAGGELFLNEGELWSDGQYVTTHLIVRTAYLEDHPDVIEKLVRANVTTTQWIDENPEEAKQLVNDGIEEVTTARLPDEVINAAWENIEITYDPVTTSLVTSADAAYDLGFLDEEPNLEGIYDLSFLNAVLEEKGLAPIKE